MAISSTDKAHILAVADQAWASADKYCDVIRLISEHGLGPLAAIDPNGDLTRMVFSLVAGELVFRRQQRPEEDGV